VRRSFGGLGGERSATVQTNALSALP